VTKRKMPDAATFRAACESEEVLKFLAKTPSEKERDRAQWLKLMVPVMAKASFAAPERGLWAARRGRK
jgi:hypothetical protein